MIPAETRFARADDVYIAYRTLGSGPRDLVFVPSWMSSNVETVWEEPAAERFFSRLASFSRLVLLDRRGLGLSDHVPTHASILEEQVDDILAVLDDVGSSRAWLFAWADACAPAVMLAVTRPERVAGLILYSFIARGTTAPDYPYGMPPERVNDYASLAQAAWLAGTPAAVAPSVMSDQATRRRIGRIARSSVPPGGVPPWVGINIRYDLRAMLPAIRVPTLALGRTNHPPVVLTTIDALRDAAERIPGVTLAELPGSDLIPWFGEAEVLLDAVEKMVTGSVAEPETDRVLATLLFTDVVDSTRRAAELGDRRWKAMLDRHDVVVAGLLERFRGKLVKHTGDGVFASFDGPARAIRCALALIESAPDLGLEIRAGLHTGEVEVRDDDLGGIAVHIAARIAALAGARETLTSSTVKDLVVGSNIAFEDRGSHSLKGVPGEWQLFAVR